MSNVEQILRNAAASFYPLIGALGISQPTLSRRISDLAGTVLTIGRGRATRYALRREIGGDSHFPLYQIDKLGKAHLFATLYPICPADSYAVLNEQNGKWRLFDGLPWYLNDLRPIGFLGRAWGKAVARQLRLPEDVQQWNGEQRLLAPLYDMLPMAFAPANSGNMRQTALEIRLGNEVSGIIWRQAERMALVFWQLTAEHPQISQSFRAIASEMLAQLQALNDRIQRLA